MVPVDHRLAFLDQPALPSAEPKKSLASVSSPILAWRAFIATVGSDFSAAPNTFAAPSRSCFLQSVIWFACTSYCCASSASVFSPLIAARATFALKAGLWFRRARLLIRDSPVPALMPISGRNSTYHPVQFCRATSVNHTAPTLLRQEIVAAGRDRMRLEPAC